MKYMDYYSGQRALQDQLCREEGGLVASVALLTQEIETLTEARDILNAAILMTQSSVKDFIEYVFSHAIEVSLGP